jgi:MoaA/NifB/PqqE/SkfB family radical SAM enzyme
VDAVATFLAAGGLQVGISAALPRATIRRVDELRRLLAFAARLGAHELWLSEVKPTVTSLFDEALVLEEHERREIAAFQDGWNAGIKKRGRGVLLNFLGHFEGAEHFGCNAGRKMIYVDPFGEVSPCVFAPFSLGNVRTTALAGIVADMSQRFPTEDRCFANRNWRLVAHVSRGRLPMDRAGALALLDRVDFRPPSAFNERYLALPRRRR